MRTRHKLWDNRRLLRKKGRYMGWNLRVIWYEPLYKGEDIKLEFEDHSYGVRNRYYPSSAEGRARAEADFAAFRAGTLTVEQIANMLK
jgi:hypothetical protein